MGWDTSDPYDRTSRDNTTTRGQTSGVSILNENHDTQSKYDQLCRRIDALQLTQQSPRMETIQKVSVVEVVCIICDNIGHQTRECPSLPSIKSQLHEQANAVGAYRKQYNNAPFDPSNPPYNPS